MLHRKISEIAKKIFGVPLYLLTPKKRARWDTVREKTSPNRQVSLSPTQIEAGLSLDSGLAPRSSVGDPPERARIGPAHDHSPKGHDIDRGRGDLASTYKGR